MRIAIVSDIHEDFENLQKALNTINELNPDKIVCLGDIIGFESKYYEYENSRSAKKCVQFLQKESDIIVSGNHELVATKQIPHFSQQIGFPNDWYTMDFQKKEEKYKNDFFLYKDEAENDLGIDELKLLSELKSWEFLNNKDMCIMFSHFIYPDINGNRINFFNTKKGFLSHFEWMSTNDIDISFVGHAHIEGVGIAHKKGL